MHGMALALGEDRHQHVGAGHFLAARRLDMEQRALHGALEAERRLGVLRHADHQAARSEEHTSELQSLMRISYAVFCLKKKKNNTEYDIYEYYVYIQLR